MMLDGEIILDRVGGGFHMVKVPIFCLKILKLYKIASNKIIEKPTKKTAINKRLSYRSFLCWPLMALILTSGVN